VVNITPANPNSLLLDVYGSLNITLLAGPNGSGKTALLSFIAQLFHNLQRFPERVTGAFEITYESYDSEAGWQKCTLSRNLVDNRIHLNVHDIVAGYVARETVNGPPATISPETLIYDDIRHYLPANIIVSGFSLHGEYPSPRPPNFLGDEPLTIYDTKNLYGHNHYGFPSFSTGIRRLMLLVEQRANGVIELENLLGGKFTGRVATVNKPSSISYSSTSQDWQSFSKELAADEQEGRIYLNDFEIETASGPITLSNMSSGQKMLFVRLLSVLSKIKHGSVVLIEEPELHLDPSWTRQLITLFLLFFSEFRAHFIIATHSFSLINALPSECVLVARNGYFDTPTQETFLANEATLAWTIFAARPNLVEQLLYSNIETASRQELEILLDKVGESAVRFEVFRKLRRMEGDK